MLTFILIGGLGVLFFAVTAITDDFHFGFDVGDHEAPWSLRTLSLFAVGFGACGYLLMYNGWSPAIASTGGAGAGLILAAFGYFLSKQIEAQEGNTLSNLSRLSGRRGIVTQPIGPDQYGEVQTVNEFGTTVFLPACSAKRLTLGAPVTIKTVIGNTVEVE